MALKFLESQKVSPFSPNMEFRQMLIHRSDSVGVSIAYVIFHKEIPSQPAIDNVVWQDSLRRRAGANCSQIGRHVSLQVKLINVNITDVVNGTPVVALGLVWTIIQHYQVGVLIVASSPPPPPSAPEGLSTR